MSLVGCVDGMRWKGALEVDGRDMRGGGLTGECGLRWDVHTVGRALSAIAIFASASSLLQCVSTFPSFLNTHQATSHPGLPTPTLC